MPKQYLAINQGKKLAGPGIKQQVKLAIKGMPHNFWQQWQAQSNQYPLGVDIFFACEDALVALPRTTLIGN